MKAGLSNPPKGEKLKRRPNLIWQPAAHSLRLLGDWHLAKQRQAALNHGLKRFVHRPLRVTENEAVAQITVTQRGAVLWQGHSRSKFLLSALNEPKLAIEADSQHR